MLMSVFQLVDETTCEEVRKLESSGGDHPRVRVCVCVCGLRRQRVRGYGVSLCYLRSSNNPDGACLKWRRGCEYSALPRIFL